jgi:predicted secreted hydrolase
MRKIMHDCKYFNLLPAMLILAVCVFCQVQTSGAADSLSVSGPCNFSFPGDHASHPDHRIEWWYYTGNLVAEDGARYGFQLTFFRVGTSPAQKKSPPSGKASAWRTDQIFMAHAALSDISSNEFHHWDRMSRAALGLAGAQNVDGEFEVFVGDSRARITPALHRLRANALDFSFSLDLAPLKIPVAHGDSGWSIKGEGPGEGSCYYSVSRLEASGKLVVGGRERPVRGTAWMDHEFSTTPLNPRFSGWDWFGLQFSDGTELMVYLMREKNGKQGPVAGGTFVDRQGKHLRLLSGDFRLQTLKTWKSPHSGALYPALWLLEVIPLDMRIKIVPNLADQEMETPRSTHITYWEGSVRAEGSGPGGRTMDGEGYAELTGYDGTVWF